jgi:hypothetical protein
VPQLIRVLLAGAPARVVLEPTHAAWISRQLQGASHPAAAAAAAKIDAAVRADAPKLALEVDECAALLTVLTPKQSELRGELLLLHQALTDTAGRGKP